MNNQASELFEKIEIGHTVIHATQKRPYSFCEVLYAGHDGTLWRGVGFAKVSQPDTWDAGRGAEVVKKRALRHVYHQLTGRAPRYMGE